MTEQGKQLKEALERGMEELLPEKGVRQIILNNRSMMQHRVVGFDDAEIARIRARTRILIGRSDRLANAPGSVQLLDRYQMNYRLIDQAGHALNHEQPAIVHAEIISFLLA